MTTLPLKKGDRLPVIDVQLIGADGAVVDLTSATGVTFTLAAPDGRVLINKAAAVVTAAATGMVRYAWAADDLDEVGTYRCEWIVTFPGSREMTFPNRGYDLIEVGARLA